MFPKTEMCVSLQQKAGKDYFISLTENHITKNKCSCKTSKPFLSNKVQFSKRIKLAEEDDTLTTIEVEVAIELNDSFTNAAINSEVWELLTCVKKQRATYFKSYC